MGNLYPFLFHPNFHSVVWGGNRLKPWKKLGEDTLPIGESWEVSVVPSSTSIISNGEYAGKKLSEIIELFPEKILGANVATQYGGQLPLLAKFIDADKDLSIQVHPDDEMAQRVHGKMGKTEMWYVIDAAPDAALYVGFKKKISQEEYKQRIANGTIAEVLARHAAKPGDAFYIPAGRVHAICGGILLAEIQQSSDITYRIYDYNRLGDDGRPRELHTELASQALDYNVERDYRIHYPICENYTNLLVDTPFFTVHINEISQLIHRDLIKYDSFVISMCIKGKCRIRIRENGNEISLCEGYSCLIPASVADYDIIPEESNDKCRILEACIVNKERMHTR